MPIADGGLTDSVATVVDPPPVHEDRVAKMDPETMLVIGSIERPVAADRLDPDAGDTVAGPPRHDPPNLT